MHQDSLMSRKASAKLNLHLQVLNRRGDNFHNLLSIMTEIGFSDLLKLESLKIGHTTGGISVEIINSGGEFSSLLDEISQEKNIVSIAVKKYLGSLQMGGSVKFSIEKNIPAGAGLGGGSSDAAAALELVREALGRERDEAYFSAAVESGSDVPFFIRGGTAFAEGRGELLEQIDWNFSFPALLVNNGIHVNTGSAYQSLNRGYDRVYSKSELHEKKTGLESALKDLSLWKDSFVNDFEIPVFRAYPELGVLKNELYDLGADFALMSGSGSTMYGVFKDEIVLKSAYEQLCEKGSRVFLINA